ncbi:MAG TPA: BTAD domain-containing putative transcriptional regulator [Burkholderiales bacterium]|nr:BTAD domain-containing putative transcriptional regulator [Burkholderiales bacterium]
MPIRIYMLGRFSVAIQGQPVCVNGNGKSNGKAKQRPLALLKALIAFGGRGVASSQIWECLWPDSEGDLGTRNLTVTLHRLRHLLRAPAAVLQHDGKLTLNEGVCWVDMWSFERSVNDGLRRLNETASGDAAELHLRAAFSLYSGHFLSRESEESWMLTPRLRLKTKFERLVAALSMHLENQDRFADAIDLCLHALEFDPLNELLYRRLMSCYLKEGEVAGVVRTYLRCREALAKGLAATPSIETERLYLEGMRAATEPSAAKATGQSHPFGTDPRTAMKRSLD